MNPNKLSVIVKINKKEFEVLFFVEKNQVKYKLGEQVGGTGFCGAFLTGGGGPTKKTFQRFCERISSDINKKVKYIDISR